MYLANLQDIKRQRSQSSQPSHCAAAWSSERCEMHSGENVLDISTGNHHTV